MNLRVNWCEVFFFWYLCVVNLSHCMGVCVTGVVCVVIINEWSYFFGGGICILCKWTTSPQVQIAPPKSYLLLVMLPTI